jgi:hypothetical protein
MGMNPTTTLALAKLSEKLAERVRSDVKPGVYVLEDMVTLLVKGTLTVGAETEYQPTTSIPWKKTLALFVRYSGITREAALSALVRAMREALDSGEEASDLVSALADLDDAEVQVQKSLDQLPAQNRLGAVSAKKVILQERAA